MPRGVYDRTKSKEQRAAEKTPAKKGKAAAAPQKRKYTKRATVEASAPKTVSSQAAKVATADDNFALMTEVRANLSVLASLGDKFSDTPSLKTEISAHVEILGKLRDKVFASDEPAAETAEVETEIEEEAAPVAAVPNGAAAYQGTVPLPPPPSVASALPPPPIPAH